MRSNPDSRKRLHGAIASVVVLGFFIGLLTLSRGWRAAPEIPAVEPVTPYIELRVECERLHGMDQFNAVRKGMTFHAVTKIMNLPRLTKSLDEHSGNARHIPDVHVLFHDPASTILQVDFVRGIVVNKSLYGPPPEAAEQSKAKPLPKK